MTIMIALQKSRKSVFMRMRTADPYTGRIPQLTYGANMKALTAALYSEWAMPNDRIILFCQGCPFMVFLTSGFPPTFCPSVVCVQRIPAFLVCGGWKGAARAVIVDHVPQTGDVILQQLIFLC